MQGFVGFFKNLDFILSEMGVIGFFGYDFIVYENVLKIVF